MNEILQKILPVDCKSYKVSYDEHLLKLLQDVWEYHEKYNTFTQRNVIDGKSYRDAVNLYDYIDVSVQKKVFEYFGVQQPELEFRLEQAELSLYHPKAINIHKGMKNRIPDVVRDPGVELGEECYNNLYGATLWHCDEGLPLNNIAMVVYLSDVEEGMGGVKIAYPIVTPTYDGSSKFGSKFFENTLTSEEVPCKEVTGPMGTIVAWNSHIVHRANVPTRGFRKAISMNFRSSLLEHQATPYEYKPHRTLDSI